MKTFIKNFRKVHGGLQVVLLILAGCSLFMMSAPVDFVVTNLNDHVLNCIGCFAEIVIRTVIITLICWSVAVFGLCMVKYVVNEYDEI